MKKLLILSLTIITCLLWSCSTETTPPIEYRYTYQLEVPDSNLTKMTTWITTTVSAASQHMTGGDYEDPEDLVEETTRQAQQIFAVKVEGLNKYKRKGGQTDYVFIPFPELDSSEVVLFHQLKYLK